MVIIKDVVHRFVEVPEICLKFIDTPEFNRLRRIRQLGLAHYVYPSATHTRFEHSIGVMFLAGKVADILGLTYREKELLQIAGLLHDTGHVAFSHLFDYILQEKDSEKKINHHEYRSIMILKMINQRVKVLTEREVEIVSKMILGDWTGEDKPYLFQIINNKLFGLDVDRLDYLQRDLYHTGMCCFQADYILQCIKIKENNLSLLKKAFSEIEMFYEARRRLFVLVCRHKTVLKIEKMIRNMIKKLDISEDWFIENWLKLDDYLIYHKICNFPEFIDIENRNLNIFDDYETNRFEHVKLILKDDIYKEINKVIWY